MPHSRQSPRPRSFNFTGASSENTAQSINKRVKLRVLATTLCSLMLRQSMENRTLFSISSAVWMDTWFLHRWRQCHRSACKHRILFRLERHFFEKNSIRMWNIIWRSSAMWVVIKTRWRHAQQSSPCYQQGLLLGRMLLFCFVSVNASGAFNESTRNNSWYMDRNVRQYITKECFIWLVSFKKVQEMYFNLL